MPGRVVDQGELLAEVGIARSAGRRIVLTNGAFDLLHVGHLHTLRRARAEGDLLVVGVNTDDSVRRLKPGRPLVPDEERAELIAALDPVNLVILFDASTANGLLEAIKPDVYVKGGDYTEATLPELDTARSIGARIVLVPSLPGRSTTNLVDRIRELEIQLAPRILCVYAHPDDESFGPAAVLAMYARQGATLHGLWATRGEHGQTVDEPGPGAVELARLREEDLRTAASLIGFRRVEILDHEDGSLDALPDAELRDAVLDRMRAFEPHVVFTFGPAGMTRHADHIAIHMATVGAFDLARTEGVPVRALFFDAVPPARAAVMGLQGEPDGSPNTWIEVGACKQVKLDALRVHARHVLDAKERAERLEREPLPHEPLFRAWPQVPPGQVLNTLLPHERLV